jgi:putative oxidoreductase
MMSVTATQRRPTKWLSLLFGTTSVGPAVDVALLAMRIALAWVFIYYGAAKLFGAFPGAGPHGLHQTALYMSHSAHLRPGAFFGAVAGLIEFGGGISMALGFLTRLSGLALFGDMVMAMITVTWATGINSASNPPGYQINMALAALALAVALIGAGRFSIDAEIAARLRGHTDGVDQRQRDDSLSPQP